MGKSIFAHWRADAAAIEYAHMQSPCPTHLPIPISTTGSGLQRDILELHHIWRSRGCQVSVPLEMVGQGLAFCLGGNDAVSDWCCSLGARLTCLLAPHTPAGAQEVAHRTALHARGDKENLELQSGASATLPRAHTGTIASTRLLPQRLACAIELVARFKPTHPAMGRAETRNRCPRTDWQTPENS